ncbi:acyltransferase ChoActase/COT/CPT [Gymnopilus junonius]|uniref:Acyltransferase ChoActase/COT/CPT n=1 Tax=Gymnopilus junonius TaxID=109634 RepID=A0A9P5NV08_GYMJU|nr:acyltransferase ChoActase/COT/CPT [Gymnopilus junonius]
MLNSSKTSTRPKGRARLPVPALRDTLDRYLRSLEPFLLEDESRGGMSFDSALALRQRWADEFETGIGKTLQERLIALDKVSPYNWLDDNFWINKAYLEWRAPLLINSNWWLAFFEDPLIPRSALSGETNNNRVGTTFWQLRRSAWLIHRMLQFRDNVVESVESDTTTLGSWLLENVSKLFNITRIPEPYCDTLSKSPHSSSRAARSILLMLHDWCYSIAVYHPPSSGSATPKLLSPGEIETRIRAVVLDVEQRIANGEKPFPVGVLSADERDRWATNLQRLLSLSPTNRETHQAILQSIMGLSLEHTTYNIPPPSSALPPSHVHTRTPAESSIDSHLHAIRGTSQNIANRFFDKAFTLIVDPSTRAGASGEHSPVDALVPSIVAKYGIVQGVDVEAFEYHHSDMYDVDGQGWERLDWVADDAMKKECESAANRAQKIIDNSDDSVLWFNNYGTDWIKSIKGRLSPDAFIQMALQLAWYRQRGEFTATYETVLTRMFKHGRTETLRTFSRESRAWVLSMENQHATIADRFKLLQQAISSHARRTKEAMTGRGFDRHILGLRLLLRPLHGESASLFEDELFDCSTQWKLSTSGLSAGLLFKGTGFGTMYEDGYGINYLAAPEIVKFGIESKYCSPLTSTQEFKEAISNAMIDMQVLCQNIDNEHYSPQVGSHL